MKKLIHCAAALSLTLGSLAFADQQQPSQQPSSQPSQQPSSQQPSQQPKRELMRTDCRFYNDKHSCVASATYWVVNKHEIRDIRYGVSCDRQTIYNDGGTYMPQEQVSDGIRPKTSAVPRVELLPQFALRNPGTYTSKLETNEDQLLNGVCYVSSLFEREDSGSGNQNDGSQSDGSQSDGSQHDGSQSDGSQSEFPIGQTHG